MLPILEELHNQKGKFNQIEPEQLKSPSFSHIQPNNLISRHQY